MQNMKKIYIKRWYNKIKYVENCCILNEMFGYVQNNFFREVLILHGGKI